jgi:predicted CXXCH cytochrome family protein
LSEFTAAAVKKVPHKECVMCHTEEDRKAIKSKINETCLKCHPESRGRDHRVGMAATEMPEKLPLAEGNIITCVTCHDQHDKGEKEKLLRMEFNALCKACHKF